MMQPVVLLFCPSAPFVGFTRNVESPFDSRLVACAVQQRSALLGGLRVIHSLTMSRTMSLIVLVFFFLFFFKQISFSSGGLCWDLVFTR